MRSKLPIPYSNDIGELQRVLSEWATYLNGLDGRVDGANRGNLSMSNLMGSINAAISANGQAVKDLAGTVDAINDDDFLTVTEKRVLVPLVDGFIVEAADMAPQVAALGITTEWTNYQTALNNLVAFLDGYGVSFDGTTKAWRDFLTDLALGLGKGKTLRDLRDAYHSAYGALRAKLWYVTSQVQITANMANSTAVTAAQNAPLIVNGLPALPNATYPANKLVYDTVTKRMYRSTGSAWEDPTLAAANVIGTLADAQLAGLSASKVTGTLTDAQLAAISAAKVTGTIGTTQIAPNAITTPLLAAGAVTAATIAANTITAAQIAANTITAAQILAGTITSSQIAAGTILASNIAAGAITASKLTVVGAGANLLGDPWCVDPNYWIVTVGTPVFLTGITDLQGGTSALANTTGTALLAKSLGLIPIDANKNYRLDIEIKNTIGSATTNYLGIAWYDANGTFLDSSVAQPTGAGSPVGWNNGSFSYFAPPGGAASSTWTNHTALFGPSEVSKIPTNARFMRVVALLNYAPTAGCQVAITAIYLRERVDGNLIVDGSITAAKILAHSITAGQILAGAIGATEIAAGSIYAKHLLVANFDNLIPNPNSETPAPAGGWLAGSYEAAGLVSGTGYSGTRSRYAPAGNILQLTPLIPVLTGDSFYFEAYIRAYATTPGVGTGFVYLRTYDAAGASNGLGVMSTQVAGSADSGWVLVKGTLSVTSATSFIAPELYAGTLTGAGGLYGDNFYLRRMADANLIVDGTLQAIFARIGKAVQSTNYAAGGVATPPTGFCLSATTFTTTFRDGSTDANCLMELGGTANINGYKVGEVTTQVMSQVNRIANPTFWASFAPWSGYSNYAHALASSTVVTYYPSATTYDSLVAAQCFQAPAYIRGTTYLRFTPSATCTSTLGSGSVTFQVTVKLKNFYTGNEYTIYGPTTQTVTVGGASWSPGQVSVDVTSYLSAVPAGYGVSCTIDNIRTTNTSSTTGAGYAVTATISLTSWELIL